MVVITTIAWTSKAREKIKFITMNKKTVDLRMVGRICQNLFFGNKD